MNNQLQQLEISVTALVAQFKALMGEKQTLADEGQRLREQQQRLLQEFDADKTALVQQYELQILNLEQSLQQVIDALRLENEQYRHMLQQSAQDINTLLRRLPADAAQEVA